MWIGRYMNYVLARPDSNYPKSCFMAVRVFSVIRGSDPFNHESREEA